MSSNQLKRLSLKLSVKIVSPHIPRINSAMIMSLYTTNYSKHLSGSQQCQRKKRGKSMINVQTLNRYVYFGVEFCSPITA